MTKEIGICCARCTNAPDWEDQETCKNGGCQPCWILHDTCNPDSCPSGVCTRFREDPCKKPNDVHCLLVCDSCTRRLRKSWSENPENFINLSEYSMWFDHCHSCGSDNAIRNSSLEQIVSVKILHQMHQPCDCGDKIRHSNGGNYHETRSVAVLAKKPSARYKYRHRDRQSEEMQAIRERIAEEIEDDGIFAHVEGTIAQMDLISDGCFIDLVLDIVDKLWENVDLEDIKNGDYEDEVQDDDVFCLDSNADVFYNISDFQVPKSIRKPIANSLRELEKWFDNEGFWPNIWQVDGDHLNFTLVRMVFRGDRG